MKSLLSSSDLLTVRDVAQRLKICPRTVWKWVSAGLVPAPLRLGKSGRTVRWKASEIDRFLAEMVPCPSANGSLWDLMSRDNLRLSE